MVTHHHPLWRSPGLRQPPGGLESHALADIVVIGAGVAGLTTAYLLAREGRDVMVLDGTAVAAGETCRTTAHLSSAVDDHYLNLERWHGPLGARLIADSHVAAIDEIERIIGREDIACEFSRLDGYLFNPAEFPGTVSLAAELAAARRAGLEGLELLGRSPVPSLSDGPVLRFPQQGQLHPLKYMAGLAHAFERAGGRIYAPAHVVEIQSGRPARVVTQSGATVTCDHVVVATNAPVNDRLFVASRQAAYRTYVIAAAIPTGTVPPALYWDTLDPYHYIRLARGRNEDRLIVGGEDHRTGQADDAAERYDRLEAWARARFPKLGAVRARWSGQVMEPVDGLAYIGRDPLEEGNVYLATGDSGHGMTHGTIAGLLLSDLIQERPNAWAELYDPGRSPMHSRKQLVAENLNELAQYADWFTAGEKTVDEIAPGEGAVVRDGLLKLAVYRDEHRELHACAAVCPHLGGIVRWNHGEKTFDCPVHGSRFSPLGKVLNGPAIRNLEPVPLPETAPAEKPGS
jgi:glycine/D-amino acid oxidase-like deaminating enzyme/nitrite reductase/ring-hydroxylating ferredoxin subunit